MAEINAKVEYKNLIGFPNYNESIVHYLKSNNLPTGFNDYSSQEIKDDLNFVPYTINNYNYVVSKSNNLVSYNNGEYIIDINENNPFKYVKEDSIIHTITEQKSITISATAGSDWVKSFIFFDTLTETFIEKFVNFSISKNQPFGILNDLWLSILDKNRVYEFDGTNWNLTTYIPIAEIDIDINNNVYVYNYPTVSNWYEDTIKSIWYSPEINEYKFPFSKSIINLKNRNYEVLLVNKVAQYGYNIGEIAEINSNPFIYVDSKFIGYLTGGNDITIISKEDYTEKTITLDNWNIMFKIW